MTDITSAGLRADPAARRAGNLDAAAEAAQVRADAVACAELLFFAYRDFTGDADAVLEEYGFGRAHHRVLHFVGRNPGLRVAQLLDILKITKQSLARVLKQLVDEGFVVQKEGAADRRERLLYVTNKGSRLADKLTRLQVMRIEQAFARAGPDAEVATRRFLLAMIAERDQPRVEALIGIGDRNDAHNTE
jgi:DNA-binding MarR family transcriptional regulator